MTRARRARVIREGASPRTAGIEACSAPQSKAGQRIQNMRTFESRVA